MAKATFRCRSSAGVHVAGMTVQQAEQEVNKKLRFT